MAAMDFSDWRRASRIQNDKNYERSIETQARQDIAAQDLQRLEDQGAMARTMLTDKTDNRRMNMQYGPNGVETERNRITSRGQDMGNAIAREQLANDGFHYQNTRDAAGNEKTNVFRRGMLLNPAITAGPNGAADLTKALQGGPAASQGDGMPGGVGSGFVTRADGSKIGIDAGGNVTMRGALSESPSPAVAENGRTPLPMAPATGVGRHVSPDARRFKVTDSGGAVAVAPDVAPPTRSGPRGFEHDMQDVKPFEPIRKGWDWLKRQRQKNAEWSNKINNRR